MMKKIPYALMAVIDDTGHLSNLEQPDAFNVIRCEFLSENLNLTPHH